MTTEDLPEWVRDARALRELSDRNAGEKPTGGEMTDNEKTRLLAENVMGWKVHHRNTAHWVQPSATDEYGWKGSVSTWSPLDVWADCMEVQAVVLAGPKMHRYITAMTDSIVGDRSGRGIYHGLLSATPRQRMDAVLKAYGLMEVI